jgi:hypothetical protein
VSSQGDGFARFNQEPVATAHCRVFEVRSQRRYQRSQRNGVFHSNPAPLETVRVGALPAQVRHSESANPGVPLRDETDPLTINSEVGLG